MNKKASDHIVFRLRKLFIPIPSINFQFQDFIICTTAEVCA